MTISTPRTDRSSIRAFTLAEVMIASTLATFVLAGVMSACLMIGRSGFNAGNYSELEAQSRRGLETFAADARKAADIHWNSAQSVTLSVATGATGSTPVTYAYDSSSTGPTAGAFYRLDGDAASTGYRRVLVRGVAADFAFRRYRLDPSGDTGTEAANDLETRLIQLTLRATRTGATTVAANQRVFSGRYILRNKRATN